MRAAVVVMVTLLCCAAGAEEWITVRDPPGRGAPAILVDSANIEIADGGIRRARVKFDWGPGMDPNEKFTPNGLVVMISVVSYNCKRQLRRTESIESHLEDGTVHFTDLSKNALWYGPPENRAADPSIDFVCAWRPK